MNRRDLLKYSVFASTAYVAQGLGFGRTARAQACASARLPGVQLYTAREPLTDDARAALTALSEMGIREVELFGLDASRTIEAQLFGLTSRGFLGALRDAGLQMSIAHIWGDWRDTAGIARVADTLGLETLGLGLPEVFAETRDGVFNMVRVRDKATLDGLVEELNRAASEYRALGLTFAYHNHHVEFIPIENGIVPYHYIMEHTDPELVKIELDIGWVGAAGLDPAAMIRRYSSRIVSCHLKDFDSRIPMPATPHIETLLRAIVEPGAGTIDFARVLSALDEAQVGHGFIEVDEPASPLDAVRKGNSYLQRVRDCAA